MKVIISVNLSLTLVFAISSVAQAQLSADRGMTPFTEQTNYMSVPGFRRYQHYLKTGQWRVIKIYQDFAKFGEGTVFIELDTGDVNGSGDVETIDAMAGYLFQENPDFTAIHFHLSGILGSGPIPEETYFRTRAYLDNRPK